MIMIRKINRFEFFKQLLNDPDRKQLLRIVYELGVLLIKYHEMPNHYFSRYLFKKNIENFKDYLPNNFFDRKIKPSFNNISVKEVLDNKLYFDMFFNKVNIKVPEVIMFNIRNIFVYNNISIPVRNVNDFKALLNDIFNTNSIDSLFIKKTNSSSGGSNIYKFYRDESMQDIKLTEEIFFQVVNSEYVFQKTVRQHYELNRLNPSSLNTIRIDTFMNIKGEIEIISAYIRMSINNICVDNISQGGCAVGIDIETGKLNKQGYSSIYTLGVKVLEEHPITGTIFEDFVIPQFNEVKELVKRVASYIPEIRLIGWDVAISDVGPVLIEGNSDYDIRRNDFVSGGYRANPVFRKVLNEINYISA